MISWWDLNGTRLSQNNEPYHIDDVLLSHEGEYECRVILGQFNIDITRRIKLFVLSECIHDAYKRAANAEVDEGSCRISVETAFECSYHVEW